MDRQPDRLTFDVAKHEYRYDGAMVPHVTGILKPLVDYSQIPEEKLERARVLGVRQHKLIELECREGIEDPMSLGEYWRPHLAAFRTMVAETGFKLLHSERQVYHRTFGYAGTLDLEGILFDEDAIIDVKRSLYAGPVIGLQLDAYREARNAERKGETRRTAIKRRYALQIKPGTKPPYKLTPYDDNEDFGVFLSLLKISRWKDKYGRT